MGHFISVYLDNLYFVPCQILADQPGFADIWTQEIKEKTIWPCGFAWFVRPIEGKVI